MVEGFLVPALEDGGDMEDGTTGTLGLHIEGAATIKPSYKYTSELIGQ